MTDARVHPATADALSPPLSSSSAKDSGEYPVPPNPLPAKPVPPPATYVVQIPREQILRYPPPENARKFQALTRRGKSGRSRCCCCTLSLLAFLVIAAAISAGVLYLVFRFKSPNYAVTSLAIKGMNLTSAAPISPEFDVTIRAENPNGKIGIYYLKGSAINVFYNDVKLSHGVLPAFYQPKKNVTVLRPALTGSGVMLGGAVKASLTNEQNQGNIPFVVRTKVPVKIKVGSVKTWKITVKAKCDVVVDALNDKAKIVSNDCDYSVKLW
ncbi:NDR1/HIN1-like protein 13 [Salvia miltiorrhiza]|uniref:NDR1/HIN1-like protein 13 n=1 Tax=Salvia miltiorrhiza TaxID=226208 RepID=UPI0025AC22BD|nr:NDR1/HIN1-like protein 13 [Salvia miltiorrhiza]